MNDDFPIHLVSEGKAVMFHSQSGKAYILDKNDHEALEELAIRISNCGIIELIGTSRGDILNYCSTRGRPFASEDLILAEEIFELAAFEYIKTNNAALQDLNAELVDIYMIESLNPLIGALEVCQNAEKTILLRLFCNLALDDAREREAAIQFGEHSVTDQNFCSKFRRRREGFLQWYRMPHLNEAISAHSLE